MLRLILEQKNLSLYKLEKKSHISHATLSDIYNEKYNIKMCHIELIYNLSKALDMNMNDLYDLLTYQSNKLITFNKEFDIFKSSVCQELKALGEKDFLIKYLKNKDIKTFFINKDYTKSIYLVSLIDLLCKRNNHPLVKDFEEIRNTKLSKMYVPESIFLLLKSNQTNITQVIKNSNKEFIKHNIVEADIENVY